MITTARKFKRARPIFGEPSSAVHTSGSCRILMMAMTAGLALIPLALGGGKSGSEIQMLTAIIILCGLVTSTLLSIPGDRRR